MREGLVEGSCLAFGRKSGLCPAVFAVGVVCAREVAVEVAICGCAAFNLKREVVVLGWGLVGEDERSVSELKSEGMAAGRWLLWFSLLDVGCLGKGSSW